MTFQERVSKQNFYACARAKKKRCHRDIPSSLKSPLLIVNVCVYNVFPRLCLVFMESLRQKKVIIVIMMVELLEKVNDFRIQVAKLQRWHS